MDGRMQQWKYFSRGPVGQEAGFPGAATELKATLSSCDAWIIASPEYVVCPFVGVGWWEFVLRLQKKKVVDRLSEMLWAVAPYVYSASYIHSILWVPKSVSHCHDNIIVWCSIALGTTGALHRFY